MPCLGRNYPHNFDKDMFPKIAYMIGQSSYSFNREILQAGDEIITLLLHKSPNRQPDEVLSMTTHAPVRCSHSLCPPCQIYNFLGQPPPLEEIRPRRVQNTLYFVGTRDQDLRDDVKRCLTQLHTHVLKLSQDTASFDIRHELTRNAPEEQEEEVYGHVDLDGEDDHEPEEEEEESEEEDDDDSGVPE